METNEIGIMEVKIVIDVKSNSNLCICKFVKSENEFAEFSLNKKEVEKLKNWGLISKSDNSTNDRDIYVGKFEI